MDNEAVRKGWLQPERLNTLLESERQRFIELHPGSAVLGRRAKMCMPDGVPMHWMRDWGTPFPLFVRDASGARFRDVDGLEYCDFCFGDTGAMFGHSPAPLVNALQRQAGQGITTMLPGTDAIAVAEHLAARFRLPFWQFTTTATDANRAALRWARAITDRSDILVFNGCYHGTVDETMVRLVDGRTVVRPGQIGAGFDLAAHTRVVEFNDRQALSRALADGGVAAVLAEPVMTNCGMVLPEPGFLEFLREQTKLHGSLLILDETHCISSGWGGYSGEHGLAPDMLTLGKPIAGGLPAATYGFSAAVREAMLKVRSETAPGHSGMGTTLSANMLSLRLMRVMLEQVMTREAYGYMVPLAEKLAGELQALFARHRLPWSVAQVGSRVEFILAPRVPRNGREAEALEDDAGLGALLHLYLLNRGVLVTPFHHMCLVCPETTEADVARLVSVLDDALTTLGELA